MYDRSLEGRGLFIFQLPSLVNSIVGRYRYWRFAHHGPRTFTADAQKRVSGQNREDLLSHSDAGPFSFDLKLTLTYSASHGSPSFLLIDFRFQS